MTSRYSKELRFLDFGFVLLYIFFVLMISFSVLSASLAIILILAFVFLHSFIRVGSYFAHNFGMSGMRFALYLLIHLSFGYSVIYITYDFAKDVLSVDLDKNDFLSFFVEFAHLILIAIWGSIGWVVAGWVENSRKENSKHTFFNDVIYVATAGAAFFINLFFVILLTFKVFYFYHGDITILPYDMDLWTLLKIDFGFLILFMIVPFVNSKSLKDAKQSETSIE